MKKKRIFGIKEAIIFNLIFLLITFLLPARIALANAPNTQYNQDKNVLFEENSGQEDINIKTGSVVYTETDLKLSGRGELDLEISRYYSNVIANLYNIGYDYNYGYNSYIGKTTLNTHIDRKYGLGCGWGLGFPSIEKNVDKESYEEINLYLGNGAVYSVKQDTEGNLYLDYYDYQDIRIVKDFTYTDHSSGTPSFYCMIKKDQSKYYFDEYGNLLAIFDPGKRNKIEFFYDSHVKEAKITSIKDSCGREILLQYDSTGKRLQSVTWEDRVIQYFHEDFSDYPESPISASDGKFSLSEVIDPEGRKKRYTYALQPAEFTFNFSIYDPVLNNYFANLVKVEKNYDQDTTEYLFSTTYEYDSFQKFIFQGWMDYFNVISRWDEGIDGEIYKNFNYTYENECYGQNLATYTSTIHYPSGTKEIFHYTCNDHLCKLRIKENAPEGLYERIEIDYDAKHNPIWRKVYKGLGTTTPTKAHDYVYDQSGYGDLLWERDEEGNEFSYKYHSKFHILMEKSFTNFSADGATFSVLQQWTIDNDYGDILEEVVYHNDGQNLRKIIKTENIYNGYGNLVLQTDVLGHEVSVEYDPVFHAYPVLFREEVPQDDTNNPVQVIEEKKGYYNDGLEKWSEDGRGHRIDFKYDKLGRITRKTYMDPNLSDPNHADHPFQSFIYDDTNDIVKSWDENGKRRDEYGNGLGMIIKLVEYGSGENHVTLKEYDELGNLKQLTDPEGKIKTITYDGFYREVATAYPDGGITITIYYDASLAKEVYDANGNQKRYEYDKLDRLIRVKEYNGGEEYTTQYVYDAIGNRISMQNAIGEKWTYKYDDLGRKIEVLYPDSRTEIFAYDDMDNLIRREDRKGQVIRYEYDERARLLKIIYQGAGEGGQDRVFVRYAYDENDNRIRMVDQGGETTYEYDFRDMVVAIHRMLGDQGPFTTRYDYDKAGNCKGIKYPFSPLWVIYEYDDFDRIESVPGYASFEYFKTGHRRGIHFNNGLNTTYQRDARHRPIRITTDQNTLDLQYRFDYEGNVLRINQDLFYYDNLDRIIKSVFCLQASGQGEPQDSGLIKILKSFGSRLDEDRWIDEADLNDDGMVDGIDLLLLSTNQKQQVYDETKIIHYDYDAVGNRLIKWESGEQDDYIYGNESRLSRIVHGNGTTEFTYDLNGNIIKKVTPDKVISYEYDYENRLIKVYQNDDPAQVLIENIYDGDGQRIKKLQNGHVSYYIYDKFGNIIRDLNEQYQERASFIYDQNRLLALRVGTNVYYYHLDHIDSVRAITAGTGEKGFWRNYYPFGKKLAGENILNLANIFGFTGKQTDEATGLVCLGARFYDPEIGRFITPDPAEGDQQKPQTLNRYAYAANNPIKYIDPLGYGLWKKIKSTVKKVFNKGKEIVNKIKNGVKRIKGKVSGFINKAKKVFSKIDRFIEKAVPYIRKGTTILRLVAPFLPGPFSTVAYALAGVGDTLLQGYDIYKGIKSGGIGGLLQGVAGAILPQDPTGMKSKILGTIGEKISEGFQKGQSFFRPLTGVIMQPKPELSLSFSGSFSFSFSGSLKIGAPSLGAPVFRFF